MASRIRLFVVAMLTIALAAHAAMAQSTVPPGDSAPATPENAVMLTVFLKHDQSRPLGELNAQLEKQGYYKAFPPDGMNLLPALTQNAAPDARKLFWRYKANAQRAARDAPIPGTTTPAAPAVTRRKPKVDSRKLTLARSSAPSMP